MSGYMRDGYSFALRDRHQFLSNLQGAYPLI